MVGLDGRNAFVTGAGGGIGRAVVRALAAAGANVAAADLSRAAAEASAAEARALGVSASAHALDVSEPGGIAEAIDGATERLGALSLGVTCAGVIEVAPALELTERQWDRTLGVNLKGTFFVLQELTRRFRAAGAGSVTDGRLVAVASVAGRSGRADALDYAASKAGVISVVRSLALAVAPDIRVNAVCPGVVDTPMTEAIHSHRSAETGLTVQESMNEMTGRIPLGAMATPEQVASVVAFLLSDEAGHVTGQSINVCGGLERD